MSADFTKLIEDALETIDCADTIEREDANGSGEIGSVLITLDDGREFRVSYVRIGGPVDRPGNFE